MNRWSVPAVVSLMAISISPSIAEGIIETPLQITTGVPEYAVKPPRDFADVQLASVGTARSQVVAINPKNPSALVVAYANKGACWVRSSNNAGQTWTGAKKLRMLPGKLNCDTVALVWAPNGGRIYAAYSYGIWDVFWDSRGAGAVFSSSTDNGLTWSNPKIAVSYPYETYRINSLKLSVSPLSSGTNWIYLISEITNVVAIHSNISRSADHGQTWSLEKNLIASYYSSTDPTSPSIAAGPSGEVIVAWGETRYPEYSDPPELPVSRVYIRRSGDYGSNFSNDLIVVPDTRAATAVAFGAFGTAHIIYTVDEPSALGAYYVYSTKAPYTSWSAPVALNEVSSANRYLAPALAVSACGSGASVLHALWMDDRAGSKTFNSYYTRKVAKNGEDWSPNLRLSGTSLQPSNDVYDFSLSTALAAAGGTAVGLWGQSYDAGQLPVWASRIAPGVTCP